MSTNLRLVIIRAVVAVSVIVVVALLAGPSPAFGQQRESRAYPPTMEGASEVAVYKTIGDTELKLYIFQPEGIQPGDKTPAIMFYFGGGWRNGSPQQWRRQSLYFASRGMVAIAVDYRVSSRHNTTPFDAVRDAKSSVRWVRQNADRLGIDPARIAVSGGSAGGHLAAAAGILEGFDEPDEDLSVSSQANAMVLYNPAVIMAPVEGTNLGRRRDADPSGETWESISPYHHVSKDAPPAITLHGRADETIPYATVVAFNEKMQALGNKSELVLFDEAGHGFFNSGDYYPAVLGKTDAFLASLGYLEGEPTVPGYRQAWAAVTSRLRAGAAKVNITPDPSELAVSTDSILDSLYVRAIVVDDGEHCAVLASVDGGARNNMLEQALPESSAATGCPIENYIVSGTHSHSASTGGIGGRGAPTPETIAAALVSAVDIAKSRLATARLGYGTTDVDLNVNRDNYNRRQEWRQEPNPNGISDKTLAVLEFLGEDDVPIAVYMNYGMHPVMFFRSGVISADFPGEASRYVEELFDNRTVALFSQAASGDQNPKLAYSSIFGVTQPSQGGEIIPVKAVLPPHQPPNQGPPRPALIPREPVPDESLAAYKKSLERKKDYVTMMGQMIGVNAVQVMLHDMQPRAEARIWAGQQTFTCAGREQIDTSKRENYDPGYKDGPDVEIQVGLLRIGDVHLVTVNGEVYTRIGVRLKDEVPAAKTMLVTLANGSAGSGYIYSDDAAHHQTFQVLRSRLKPGCAEDKIVSTAIDLMHRSGL